MSDTEALERRVSAVERAISGDDSEIDGLAEAATRERRLDHLEERVATMEEAVTELEAATQALRGYVGNVRSVNRDVERRADAALAAVERLEGRRGTSTDPRRSSSVGRSGLDTHDADTEMPVPGAGDGTRSSEYGNREGDGVDVGVLDRIRDAL